MNDFENHLLKQINQKKSPKSKIKMIYEFKKQYNLTHKYAENLCEKSGVDIKLYNTIEYKKEQKDRMKWYDFYVDIRFPLFFIFGIFNIINNISTLKSGSNYIYISDNTKSILIFKIILSIILYILSIAVYKQMKNYKGYVINNVFLILELFSSINAFSLSPLEPSIICGLIWTLPNLIYFYKRYDKVRMVFDCPENIGKISQTAETKDTEAENNIPCTTTCADTQKNESIIHIKLQCEKLGNNTLELRNYISGLLKSGDISKNQAALLYKKYHKPVSKTVETKDIEAENNISDLTAADTQEKELKCKKCGKVISPDSKFCEHCGKKIKVKVKKHNINLKKFLFISVLCALFIGLAVSVTFNIIQYNDNYDLKSQISEIEENLKGKVRLSDYYQERYNYYFDKCNDYQDEISNLEDKADFMDDFIEIVGVDENYYHKYDCEYLDDSKFNAFDYKIANKIAKLKGYHKCAHCH